MVISVMVGCEKEDVNPHNSQSKYLKLDAIKRAYYNSDNMRYETNAFSIDSTKFTYNINVEEGKQYRVYQYGLSMVDVDLFLHSENEDSTLLIGVQANVGYTAKYFVYTANFAGKLQIITASTDNTLYGEPFYLSFEEIGTYKLSWKGYNWLCDGDWTVNSNGDLTIKNYRSGFSKWIRLLDTSLTNYNVDVQFHSPTNSIPHSFGVAILASNTIFDMINLPDISRQFFIFGTNNWEIWYINIGNSGGIGRDIGTTSNAIALGSNTISANVSNINTTFYVNNTEAVSISNDITENNSFYITNEDLGTDSITITNIRFN